MPELKSLPVKPEEFDCEMLKRLSADELEASLMTDVERRFLNGLLRVFKPRNVLEIGVARGGGTCIILNALAESSGAKLTSVDLSENVADIAQRRYGSHPGWRLIAGNDPADVIEALDGPFDFMVLDTAHIHPVETLNFLSVFPYLTKDAVVVLHDIELFTNNRELSRFPRLDFACKLLFDTITADKLKPKADGVLPVNIGAFQIIPETGRFIGDVFSMLRFPWGILPGNLGQIGAVIEKNYSSEHYAAFRQSVILKDWFSEGLSLKDTGIADSVISLPDSRLDTLLEKRKLIFYGCGQNCGRLLWVFKRLSLRPPDEIWDINAGNIREFNGIPVLYPDFEALSDDVCGMVVTPGSVAVFNRIENRLRASGFYEYIGLEALILLSRKYDVRLPDVIMACDLKARIDEISRYGGERNVGLL